MCGCFKPHHHIRLSAGIKSDFKMWLMFLNSFNGITYFPETNWCGLNILEFFTDSAGSIGMGCGHISRVDGFFSVCLTIGKIRIL